MTLAIKYFKFSVIYVVVFIIKAEPEHDSSAVDKIPENIMQLMGRGRSNKTARNRTAEKKSMIGEEAVDIDELIEWTSDKTVAWIYGFMRGISKHYPKTTRMVEIGVSRLGNPIYVLEVTHSIYTGATVIIDAGMDPTDRLGIHFAIFLLHQLIQNLDENLALLAGVKIAIIPLVNPDKYNENLNGIESTCQEPLDKNFAIGTLPAIAHCNPHPGFFTEPETKALRYYYLKAYQFKLYLNVHSGSPLIATPFAYKNEDVEGILSMAENMKDAIEGNYTHFSEKVTIDSLHKINGKYSGSPVDWVHEMVRVPYSLYLSLDRGWKSHSIDASKTLIAYFQGFKYAILQLQMTDPDVAMAILEECGGKEMIYMETILIPILLFIYFN